MVGEDDSYAVGAHEPRKSGINQPARPNLRLKEDDGILGGVDAVCSRFAACHICHLLEDADVAVVEELRVRDACSVGWHIRALALSHADILVNRHEQADHDLLVLSRSMDVFVRGISKLKVSNGYLVIVSRRIWF